MSNPSMLPLHKSCKDAAKQLDSHLGLYFDKYFPYYGKKNQNETSPKDKHKHKFLQNFKKTSIPASLEHANINQVRLIQKLNGTFKAFKTTSSFVTGMGQDHPLENGFAFHPTYGTPYLPGSSVKGMLRHFFTHHYQWQDETGKKAFLNHVFGSDNPDQPAIGNYLFFDALPTETVTMHTEIMTPHYGDWYAKGGDTKGKTKLDGTVIPGDWHKPIPIQFLAVKNATFLFAIAPRNGTTEQHDYLSFLFKGLDCILMHLGAGAKTATGFGYMAFNEEQTEKSEENALTSEEKAERARKIKEQKQKEIKENAWKETKAKEQAEAAKRAAFDSTLSTTDKWFLEKNYAECSPDGDALVFKITKPNKALKDPDLSSNFELKKAVIEVIQVHKEKPYSHTFWDKTIRKKVNDSLKKMK